MTIQLTYPRTAAGLIAGIIIGLFLSGVAYAVTSNVFRYSAPQTASYAIPAGAMVHDTDGGDYAIAIVLQNLGATDCFQTAVNLPQGAKVTRLTVWHRANTAGSLNARLTRTSFNTGVRGDIATLQSTDATFTRVAKAASVSGTPATVNNDAFGYAFIVCLGHLDTFEGARLAYTYRDAGD